MTKKRILVIGLGPVGGIFAAHLAEAGHDVCGIDPWEEHTKAIRERGIKVMQHDFIQASLHKVCTHAEMLGGMEFDYVAIAVKTPYMPIIKKDLISLPGEFKIIVLQNGLDNEYFFAEHFGQTRVLRMVINYAGKIEAPGKILMNFFNAPNYVGCTCSNKDCTCSHEIADMISEANLATQPTPDIKRYIWQKVILNACMSPISAIVGITMADVINNQNTYQMAEKILREALAVAEADGFHFGDDFANFCLKYFRQAGAHKPSMLVDLERGNPTEIEYINGKIIEYGHQYQVPVPFNMAITSLVKAKEFFNKNDKN